LTVAIALLAGCNTKKNYKLLTFFFDGVPNPAATNGAATSANTTPVLGNARPVPMTFPGAKADSFVHHPPYDSGTCKDCHEDRFSVQMKGPLKDVCFACHDDFLAGTKVQHQPATYIGRLPGPNLSKTAQGCSSCHNPHGSPFRHMLLSESQSLCWECHDNFLTNAAAKFTHPPVVTNNCLNCHQPHVSKFPKLLTKSLKDTCLECHKTLTIGRKVVHPPAAEADCAACHDPHASANKGLLKKPAGPLCWECHDDFRKGAKSVHQPVDSGECMSCHAPHASDNKSLLLKTGVNLCWECHDNFFTNATAKVKHQPAENGECATCHKPHASANPKLLTKPGAALCWECHDNFLTNATAKVKHQPAENGECTACHNPTPPNARR
jgi:predicted CXXCH cytochrome family protein